MLTKLLSMMLLTILVVSCSKNIDSPTNPEPVKGYRLVIKCTSFKLDTLVTPKFTIVRWVCVESKIDTLKN